MRESNLEKKVKSWVTKQGGIFFKNPPTVTGRFDFEYTLPCYRGVWVIAETKSSKRKLTMEQVLMMKRLRDNGCICGVIKEFDDLLKLHNEVMKC